MRALYPCSCAQKRTSFENGRLYKAVLGRANRFHTALWFKDLGGWTWAARYKGLLLSRTPAAAGNSSTNDDLPSEDDEGENNEVETSSVQILKHGSASELDADSDDDSTPTVPPS
eukprot:Rmarinus@m.15993